LVDGTFLVTKTRHIAAIGNFDGVHLGHRMLLARTSAFAAAQDARAAALVFDPHPRRYFRPDDPPFLLTTAAQRARLLAEAGAVETITLTFDAGLAALSPEDFVEGVLARSLNLAGVVTGSDFRFGAGRTGDAQSLSRLARAAGLATLIVEPEPLWQGAEKIGSSLIRLALQQGDVAAAARMLGRPWSVEGIVEDGAKRGRTIGFPTANLTLGELIEPRRGVYAVTVRIGDAVHGGVANFGRRPTVGAPAPLLETHLFDFNGDLYGQAIEVSFRAFLRDEVRFDGLDALKAQIARDAEAARDALSA